MAMKTIDFSYFIERYNSGEMDSLEKKWFQKELEGNSTLMEEVKLRKRVDDALVKHDLIDLRNKLAKLEKSRKEQVTTGDGKKGTAIRFAAAIAVLMILGTLLYMTFNRSANPDRLFQANYDHYVYSGTSRTSASNNDMSFKSALDLYNNENYQAASTALKDYLIHNPGNNEAMFLLGASDMESGNYNSAIQMFTAVLNDRDNFFLDKSQWYLSLCYLKTGNTPEAVKELQAIINSTSIYNSKARKLVKKLK
jgi:TolA-binding protein